MVIISIMLYQALSQSKFIDFFGLSLIKRYLLILSYDFLKGFSGPDILAGTGVCLMLAFYFDVKKFESLSIFFCILALSLSCIYLIGYLLVFFMGDPEKLTDPEKEKITKFRNNMNISDVIKVFLVILILYILLPVYIGSVKSVAFFVLWLFFLCVLSVLFYFTAIISAEQEKEKITVVRINLYTPDIIYFYTMYSTFLIAFNLVSFTNLLLSLRFINFNHKLYWILIIISFILCMMYLIFRATVDALVMQNLLLQQLCLPKMQDSISWSKWLLLLFVKEISVMLFVLLSVFSPLLFFTIFIILLLNMILVENEIKKSRKK